MTSDSDKPVQSYLLPQLMQAAVSLHRSGVLTTDDKEITSQTDEKQILSTVANIMATISQMHPDLTADQLMRIRSMLESMSTKHNHAEMLQIAEDTARNFSVENNLLAQGLTPEQHLKALWNDYDKRDKENADEFEKLYHANIISREQLDHIRNERSRLDTLPQNSQDRIDGELRFVDYQHLIGLNASKHTNGNNEAAASCTKILENTEAQEKELEAIHLLNNKQHQRESNTNSINTNLLLDDAASTEEYHPLKMEVVNVTQNDIMTPARAKERQAHKYEGKA